MARGVAVARFEVGARSSRVAVLARYSSRPGCRVFIYVEQPSGRDLVKALGGGGVEDPATAAELPWPRLYATARINRDRRPEVIVVVAGGNVASQFAIYEVQRRALAPLTVGRNRAARFSSHADSYSATTVDCGEDRPGDVISSAADRAGRGWIVNRAAFRAERTRLRLVRTQRIRTRSLDGLYEFARRPNARVAAFNRCASLRPATP